MNSQVLGEGRVLAVEKPQFGTIRIVLESGIVIINQNFGELILIKKGDRVKIEESSRNGNYCVSYGPIGYLHNSFQVKEEEIVWPDLTSRKEGKDD